ncbi:uncharacterized protein LOC117186616 [Drosophila miranda]|uniref:uncharacterized protein LOC117186616 n=1 Tax=Drosophila miranda TaxID=7229 RepID=UPI00143F9654|nr:uncharacterized protein LOC117186616 [Drosophila miranda]
MDCEMLLSEIAVNPVLWNKRDKNYSNRLIFEKTWQAIANKLGKPAEQCKKKFKYLKDEYRKAQRNVPRPASGAAAAEPHVSKFKYFNLMHFSRDDFGGETDGNIGGTYIELMDDTSMPYSAELYDTEIALTKDDIEKPGPSKRHNKRQKDMDNELIEIEHKKLKLLEMDIENNTNNKDSDDLLFFKSLIPLLPSSLSASQKLRMRTDIQNVVLKYLEED